MFMFNNVMFLSSYVQCVMIPLPRLLEITLKINVGNHFPRIETRHLLELLDVT